MNRRQKKKAFKKHKETVLDVWRRIKTITIKTTQALKKFRMAFDIMKGEKEK